VGLKISNLIFLSIFDIDFRYVLGIEELMRARADIGSILTLEVVRWFAYFGLGVFPRRLPIYVAGC
jgi:hypothetical protein